MPPASYFTRSVGFTDCVAESMRKKASTLNPSTFKLPETEPVM